MYTLPFPVLLLMLIQMEIPGQEDDYTEYREGFFRRMSYVCIRAYASCVTHILCFSLQNRGAVSAWGFSKDSSLL
jgi:hypothetical protein